MVTRHEFYYPSKDGGTEIHTIEWRPDEQPKAVVQICHGMMEHISRYNDFAEFLCNNGYYVVGNDHLGHGRSIQDIQYFGFFNEWNGNSCLLGDIHTLRLRTERRYPGIPYFMLGHSMGTILLRQYIQQYGNGLSGVIMLGAVAERNRLQLDAGRLLCLLIAAFRGWHHRSYFVDDLVVGEFEKKTEKEYPHSRRLWVTSDKEMMQKYLSDPLCMFTFTVNGYYGLLTGMVGMQKREGIASTPKDLPIHFAAGTDDPVGDFATGVEKIYKRYQKAGIEDVTLKIYPGDRHELLSETDREQVYEDLLEWMDEHM